jgi:hypothetical protein
MGPENYLDSEIGATTIDHMKDVKRGNLSKWAASNNKYLLRTYDFPAVILDTQE